MLGDGLKFHDFTGDKRSWSIFANDRWEITKGLTLLLDLQYQHRHYELKQDEIGNFRGANRHAFTVEYDFFNPRGGFYWELPDQVAEGRLGIYGHLGVTRLEPSLYDLYDTWSGPEYLGVAPLFGESKEVLSSDGQTLDYLEWSNPLVPEEEALNYELGAAWRNGTVSVALNGYWMDIDNEIVPFGGTYLSYPVKASAERTRHRGLELDLRVQLSKRHHLRVVASRSWDEFDKFIFSDEGQLRDFTANPIALFPEYIGSLIWRAEWGALDSTFRFRGVGRQYLDNTGQKDRTIDPYKVLDIGLGISPAKLGWQELAGLRLDFRLRNVLDEEYETNGYWAGTNFKIPAANRNFLLGVGYDF
jgi:iron complex outermembrane receptor protein